jgi:hypothetical protein
MVPSVNASAFETISEGSTCVGVMPSAKARIASCIAMELAAQSGGPLATLAQQWCDSLARRS